MTCLSVTITYYLYQQCENELAISSFLCTSASISVKRARILFFDPYEQVDNHIAFLPFLFLLPLLALRLPFLLLQSHIHWIDTVANNENRDDRTVDSTPVPNFHQP